MGAAPVLRRIIDDKNIRQYVKEHGEVIEEGEFETYQIDIEHINELSKKFKQSKTIATGIMTLPSMFVVGVISSYDVFLSNLIRAVLITLPDLLSASERNISFKELVEIGSIEDARNQIIEKEIDGVIRESHSDQIKWLERKLNMPLNKGLEIWQDFIELCECRNLITHTGGIVSSQYLKACRQHGIDTKGLIVGQELKIDRKYFERAVTIIFEMSVKLTQVIPAPAESDSLGIPKKAIV